MCAKRKKNLKQDVLVEFIAQIALTKCTWMLLCCVKKWKITKGHIHNIQKALFDTRVKYETIQCKMAGPKLSFYLENYYESKGCGGPNIRMEVQC